MRRTIKRYKNKRVLLKGSQTIQWYSTFNQNDRYKLFIIREAENRLK